MPVLSHSSVAFPNTGDILAGGSCFSNDAALFWVQSEKRMRLANTV